ncbi:MAG: MBL fold metallo-hydrolase, partial [Woeseiaceae bacterium]|nr:MBL fold metallo-hydrolase [Woeseiaceae bacterium]
MISCQPNPEPRFAKVVSSAEVEVRDGPTAAEIETPTQVVVLGTGTPIPDAYRAGPSIAVVHKGQAYLFDIGAGAIRNATVARYMYDIPSLYPSQICCLFLTHLHSDHTTDYPELVATLWWRRQAPFSAWGPKGLIQMTNSMYEMMAQDIALRQAGTGPVDVRDSYKVDVTEIDDGVVFERDGMRIEAFSVNHGAIKPAFGYRITTADKRIVISGDTA